MKQDAREIRDTAAGRVRPSGRAAKMVAGVCGFLLVASLLPAFAGAQEGSASQDGAGTLASGTTSTPPKEEIVYASLDAQGEPQGIYVVNSFDFDAAGQLSDPGVYAQLTNLSTTDELKQDSATVTARVPQGNFYYQGDLPTSTKLPWDVSVKYRLDGKNVDAAHLAGSSGALIISLDITPAVGADAVFTDNYLLQVSAAFPTDKAANLAGEGATLAQAGSDTQATFMVMPGQAGHYTLSAQVNDFSFDGFRIAGVPANFAIDLNSADTSTMTGDITQLQDAIATLDSGAGELSGGSTSIESGLSILAGQSSTLTGGSSRIASGIGEAASGASQLSDNLSGQVAPGVDSLAQGSSAFAAGMQGIIDANAAAASQLSAAQAAYGAALAAVYAASPPTPADIAALDTAAQNLAAVSAASGAYQTASGLQSNYGAIDSGLSGLNASMPQLTGGADALSGGLSTLDSQYATFDSGISSYTGGVGTLAKNYSTFNGGVSELAQGTGRLKDATGDLDQQIIDGIKDQLAATLDPSFTPHSFVAPGNVNVSQVQFVMMTDAVTQPEEEVETPEVPEQTLWDRIVGLFS